jgi:nucleotide-binding universal stress UspA family protein
MDRGHRLDAAHIPVELRLGPVIVVSDGSEGAHAAAMVAGEIVRLTGDQLHLVHGWQLSLVEDVEDLAFAAVPARNRETTEDRAEDVLGQAMRDLEAKGVTVTGAHLLTGSDSEVVAGLAEELDAGLVVVGARGPGRFERLLHGGASRAAVRRTLCPVLVVRDARWPPARVVVGEDGSAASRRAAEVASRIAAHPALDVTHIHVALEEDAARALVEATGDDGLLAVGHHGHGPADGSSLGSVCQRVLEAARGPVLVCHATGPAV